MGTVRIVGGALRGRRIPVPERGVRPTSDRTREAIFDVLGPAAVQGARVLDLFAGTGALGIEALSRGAERADFLEGSPRTARRIEESVRTLGVADRSRIRVADLGTATLPSGVAGPWRLIFLDPPYEGGAGAAWVEAIASLGWLEEEGVLVYEHRKGAPAPAPGGLEIARERTYGDAAVAFYRRAGAGRRA
jgi:16S rRNA (guanine966-N2)-methyltransferase